MKNMTSEDLIDKFKLVAHPEGGYFHENYRSDGIVNSSSLWNGAEGTRNYSTGIYFLLEKKHFSAFHRIKQDEMWHFYAGSTLLLHMINEKGDYRLVKIGNNINEDNFFQYVVPAGTWFASEVEDKNSFSFCGCTVSPGFDFKDFEMPSRKKLLSKFPNQQKIISRLTYR
jgi:predicted cupin superfamily sugar epimerase